MNRILKSFLLPVLSASVLYACDPVEPVQKEEEFIELGQNSINVPYSGIITTVSVSSNSSWVLKRTDETGAEIDWVKFDKLSGKGSVELGVKVLENPGKEARTAMITLEAGSEKAFLDIVQEANPNEEPVVPPGPGDDPVVKPEGYGFPMYQIFTTGQSIDIESGKVLRYAFDQMPVLDAVLDGSKVSFKNGLVIEASAGTFSVARPAHTNPTKFAGFQEGLCLEGFEKGSITYTIPFNTEVYGKLRFFKGQRREKDDSYEWSTDGGASWTAVGPATGGASDAFWKYLDFEIPQGQKVAAGGALLIRDNVTYNSSSTYGGIMLQCGVALLPGEAEMSALPAQDARKVVFAEGFDNIRTAPAAMILDYGFMKSWTSGKYTAPSYTTEAVASMPAIVTPEYCYSRPGFLQIGYADEAMAFAAKEYYLPGSYKVALGERLKEMGLEKADLTVSFRACGITTAFEEKGNAAPVLTATTGTVSDGGVVALTADVWGDYSFTVKGADQSTVIEISSNSAEAGARAGKPDNRFFIDDILVEASSAAATEPVELFFDFANASLNWPAAKSVSWSESKSMDSGLALDNGGTATENTHRRAVYTYSLNGNDYDFSFADPDGATAHNIYWTSGKGVYSGTLRYFGLPIISGMKLTRVVMVQGASTKDPSAFTRNVGICSNVVDAADKGVNYISGGEVQNQATNGASYTYELQGTDDKTVYWLHSPSNASIIVSLALTYEAL